MKFEYTITKDFKRYVMRRLMRTDWYFQMPFKERKDLFLATQLACIQALAAGTEIDLSKAPEITERS